MATTIAISVLVFLICGLIMGLGALTNRKSSCMQRGTCGGNPIEVNGSLLTCSSCPKRNNADAGAIESTATSRQEDGGAVH